MDYFTYVILTVVICSIQVTGFSIKRIDSTTRKGDGRKPKFFIPRKILGGSSSQNDDMLYVLSMDIRGSFTCGASAITIDWAISAAHCLDKEEQPQNVILWSDSKKRMTGKPHRVEGYILYPRYYRPVTNDIALLKVTEPFVIGKSLSLIPLMSPHYNLEENTEMVAAGWGITTSGESSDYLLKTTINYISNYRCSEIEQYIYTLFFVTDGMLCGFSEGRDITQGDSGGPLVLRTQNGDVLVGIISYGSGEGKKNGPSIYTRVSEYVDWIHDAIRGTVDPVNMGWQYDRRYQTQHKETWNIDGVGGGHSNINKNRYNCDGSVCGGTNNFYRGGGAGGDQYFWKN